MKLRAWGAGTQHALRHEMAVRAIAVRFQRPLDEVRARYQSELASLLKGAAVVDFIPVLAEKHVRAWFMRAALTLPITSGKPDE